MGICNISCSSSSCTCSSHSRSYSRHHSRSCNNIRCCQPFPEIIIMRKRNDSAKFMRQTRVGEREGEKERKGDRGREIQLAWPWSTCCSCTYSSCSLATLYLAGKHNVYITPGTIISCISNSIRCYHMDVRCWAPAPTTTALGPLHRAVTLVMGKCASTVTAIRCH